MNNYTGLPADPRKLKKHTRRNEDWRAVPFSDDLNDGQHFFFWCTSCGNATTGTSETAWPICTLSVSVDGFMGVTCGGRNELFPNQAAVISAGLLGGWDAVDAMGLALAAERWDMKAMAQGLVMTTTDQPAPAPALPRFLQRLLDQQTYPVLVVLSGKHDTAYYLANDPPQLLRTFVEIVRVRVEDENYINEPDPKPYGLKPDELTADQIAALPTEGLKATARAVVTHNERARREHADELETWELVKKALAGDGGAAFQVLKAREDYEYEGFRLVEPTVIATDAPIKAKKAPRRRK